MHFKKTVHIHIDIFCDFWKIKTCLFFSNVWNCCSLECKYCALMTFQHTIWLLSWNDFICHNMQVSMTFLNIFYHDIFSWKTSTCYSMTFFLLYTSFHVYFKQVWYVFSTYLNVTVFHEKFRHTLLSTFCHEITLYIIPCLFHEMIYFNILHFFSWHYST